MANKNAIERIPEADLAIRITSNLSVYAPLRETMTSSTKPQVHIILHCCQTTTEPWPQVTGTENFVKFRRVVYEICQWTDIQTNRHSDRNTSHPSRGRSSYAIITSWWRKWVIFSVMRRRCVITSEVLLKLLHTASLVVTWRCLCLSRNRYALHLKSGYSDFFLFVGLK